MKKRRKPKKRTTAAKACRYIQLYVKLLETDENGYGYCCSCGKSKSWHELQGGHFQPKGINYNGACLEEENVHIQCVGCNNYRQGNPAGYSKFMLDKYGEDVIDYIKQKSYEILDIEEAREMAKIYKQKCKDLVKTKNFEVRIPS